MLTLDLQGFMRKQLPNNSAIVHLSQVLQLVGWVWGFTADAKKWAKLWAAHWYANADFSLFFLQPAYLTLQKTNIQACLPEILNVCPQRGFLRWRQPEGMFKASGSLNTKDCRRSPDRARLFLHWPGPPLTAVVRVGRNHSFIKRFLPAIAWHGVCRQCLAELEGKETWSCWRPQIWCFQFETHI